MPPDTDKEISVVFEPGESHCFIYSHYNRRGIEFLCLNVPACITKQVGVAKTMNFLCKEEKECKHGETVHSNDMYFVLKTVEGEHRESLLNSHMTATDNRCDKIFELVPRMKPDPEHVDCWGSYPPAPNGRIDLVEGIVKIWMNQSGFMLYKDGNPGNCSLGNLKLVDLAIVLKHPDRYKVDWDADLSPEQETFVLNHLSYFRKIARSLWRPIKKCNHCGLLGGEYTGGTNGSSGQQELARCSACKMVWYCCKEHQVLDWKEHKSQCREMQDKRRMK